MRDVSSEVLQPPVIIQRPVVPEEPTDPTQVRFSIKDNWVFLQQITRIISEIKDKIRTEENGSIVL